MQSTEREAVTGAEAQSQTREHKERRKGRVKEIERGRSRGKERGGAGRERHAKEGQANLRCSQTERGIKP